MRLVLISFFALTFNFSQAYSADQSLLNQIDRTIAPSCEINEVPAPNEPTGKLNIKRCELFNSNHLPVLIISQVGDSEAKLYRPGEMTPLVFNDQEYGSLQTAMLRFSADDEDLMKNNMKAYNHSKDCDSLHSNQYNNGLSPIAGDTLFDGLMKVSLQPGGSPLRLNTDVLKKQGKLTRAEDNARMAMGYCGSKTYDGRVGGGPCTILSGRLVLVTAHHLCNQDGSRSSAKYQMGLDSTNHPQDIIEIDFEKSYVAGSDGPGKCNNLRLQNPENDWAIAVLKEDVFKKYPHRGYHTMKISDQNPADYSKGDNCRFFAFHIDKHEKRDFSKYMERGCKYNNYKPSYQNYILEYFNSTQRSSGSPGTVCNGRYDEGTNECLGEYELMTINVNGNLQARYQCQTKCANGSVVISNNTDVLSKLDEMKRLYP